MNQPTKMVEGDYDPATGELLEHPVEHAADSLPMPRKAMTVADTMRLLEDGQFDLDASVTLRELIQRLEAHAFTNRGVSKGKFTIELDISLANGAHVVVPSIKVKAPEPKRLGTILFAHEDGGLSRNPPGQGALFGIRSVPEAREIRKID